MFRSVFLLFQLNKNCCGAQAAVSERVWNEHLAHLFRGGVVKRKKIENLEYQSNCRR